MESDCSTYRPRIRLRHPYDKLANLGHDPGPSGLFPPLAVVPLPRNQPSVPSQQGFRCDDTGDFCQEFPAKRLTLYREPTSLVVCETKLPPAKPSVEDFVLLEGEYTRIRGALSNLGHTVARSTIANILREHGIEPAPERSERTPWRTFLAAHWETVAATDFFTVEVATVRRLVTYYVLVVIELSSRKVHIAGITPGPDGPFMMQVGRNLTDPFDGFLRGKRFLILDRDKKFTTEFRDLLEHAGTDVIRLPHRSPESERLCRYPTVQSARVEEARRPGCRGVRQRPPARRHRVQEPHHWRCLEGEGDPAAPPVPGGRHAVEGPGGAEALRGGTDSRWNLR